MLITSPRHTPQDLHLWHTYERSDIAHAMSGPFIKKVMDAKKTIQSFAQQPCYVSISWGKDSLVLAHLVWSVFGKSGPLAIWHARPERMPETQHVEQTFLESYPLYYRRIESAKESAVKEFQVLSGSCRCILGIRADESMERRLSAYKHGAESTNRCRPLLWWSAQDVFAYLAINKLPIHPAYAMLGGGRFDRHHIRVEILGGPEGRGIGRAEWEREYYGDILRRREALNR